ncbi:hypothetical protein ID875_21145 [Streptomyces globisporus]|uniref:Uncharacterized protein n=1 Tax=Streptomyces globisporus TaxID=1908 RepID=A0A927GPB9_STRGL|nr:hypothetical protein [Streptomyces globisporus]
MLGTATNHMLLVAASTKSEAAIGASTTGCPPRALGQKVGTGMTKAPAAGAFVMPVGSGRGQVIPNARSLPSPEKLARIRSLSEALGTRLLPETGPVQANRQNPPLRGRS